MTIQRTIALYKGDDYFPEVFPIYVNRIIESFEISEHSHDFLEITYVSEGSGTHYIGDQQIKVSRGDIFLIPVGVSHVFRPASTAKNKPLIVYNCVVSIEAVHFWLQTIPGSDALLHLLRHSTWQRYHDRNEECSHLFQNLYAEYATNRPGKHMSLYLMVMALLLFLYRSDDETFVAPSYDADAQSMDAVLEFLQDNFQMSISQQQVSHMLGVGERQCYRLFMKHTGMSLINYVQLLRINEACRLLQTTDRKVSDIALEVGYRDTPFFNQLFKRKTGLSPRMYRNKEHSTHSVGEDVGFT